MESGYIYSAFGLTLYSEIEIPELMESSGTPDVTIRFGQVPMHLEKPGSTGVRFEAAPDEFLLNMDTVGRYLVTKGKEIIIEPKADTTANDIRVFLLSSVIAALLHQRGCLVLHASCIEEDGEAILFSGASGSGKSTLAAAFYNKGYQVLCDDLAVVFFDENEQPYVVPGIPSLKLWEDSLHKLEQKADSLVLVRESLQKYRVYVNSQYQSQPLPLKRMYILSSASQTEITVAELNSFDKMRAINNNTFRKRFLDGQGAKTLHFKQCTMLAQKVRIFKVKRPRSEFLIEELLFTLEKEMAN